MEPNTATACRQTGPAVQTTRSKHPARASPPAGDPGHCCLQDGGLPGDTRSAPLGLPGVRSWSGLWGSSQDRSPAFRESTAKEEAQRGGWGSCGEGAGCRGRGAVWGGGELWGGGAGEGGRGAQGKGAAVGEDGEGLAAERTPGDRMGKVGCWGHTGRRTRQALAAWEKASKADGRECFGGRAGWPWSHRDNPAQSLEGPHLVSSPRPLWLPRGDPKPPPCGGQG